MHKNITLLAVSLINCLRHIYGTSLCDHVPNVDMLNRCNTFCAEPQLQGKRLRWLGYIFRIPHNRLPKKLLLRGAAPQVALT